MALTKQEHLEFLIREYFVVTDRLMQAFAEIDGEDYPPAIRAAIDQLASAINATW